MSRRLPPPPPAAAPAATRLDEVLRIGYQFRNACRCADVDKDFKNFDELQATSPHTQTLSKVLLTSPNYARCPAA